MAPDKPTLDIDPSSLLYRIQNVDFSTYLELYDAVDLEQVVLRTLKEDRAQQWKFILDPVKKSFKIFNAATEGLDIPLYLVVDVESSVEPNKPITAKLVCRGESEDPADPKITQWSIKQVNNAISITCPSKKGYLYFLQVDEDGKIGCVEEKITNNQQPIKQGRQWRRLEVLQSLVTDNYRIRTLNGTALYMRPGGALSIEAVNKGQNQEWDVKWLGNGKCTIRNLSEKFYLGWEERKDDTLLVRKSSDPKPWYLTPLGEYTYTITYKGTDGAKTPSFSLTCGENREVILKTNKVAHNRIWMFEPVDVRESDTNDQDTPAPPTYHDATKDTPTKDTSAKQPSNDKAPPTGSGGKYVGITEHFYTIQNVGTGKYMGSITDGKVTVGGGDSSWYIRYPGASAEMLLSYNYSSDYCGISDDILTVDSSSTSTKWIVDGVRDTSSDFYFYISPAINKQVAITHDASSSNFSITSKRGNLNQMWRLRDAPPNIGNRFPEITTQNFYSIKNVATGQYLATPSGGTITASSSGTSWCIQYPRGTGEVLFSQTSSSHYIGISGFSLSVDRNSTSITWILDRVRVTDNTFCFYICPTINQQLAVTHGAVGSNFSMTAKLPGNQNQLWTFSDAPPVPNRYPEIENGPHTIKNVFTGESIAYTSDGNFAGTGSSGTTWQITYVDSSAEFILSYYASSCYCILHSSGFLPHSGYNTSNATRCILERVYAMDGSICYYIIPSNNRAQALTQSGSSAVLANKEANNARQFWML